MEIEIFTSEDDWFGETIHLKKGKEYELVKMPDNTFMLQTADDPDIGGDVILNEFSDIDRIVFRTE